MTKAEALALYDRATIMEDGWEAAAHALAVMLRPAKIASAPKKNKRQSIKSVSGLTSGLPKFVRQNCGHTFNSSGCATCPYCERPRPYFKEGVSPLQRRHEAIQASVLAEWAARNPGKKNRFHV